ncbi:MAG: LysM peptidoglycan-binding domain-containing protein [Clostridia bacterium]|nr:LysM peptidoglycan-binding domain-containing protein [Clostridia bacterium]
MTVYTVEAGDTLYSIAKKYSLTEAQIVADNLLYDADRLVPGQALALLSPAVTHRVKRGETLFGLSKRFGVSMNALYQNNPVLGGLPEIFPGQTLVIRYRDARIGSAATEGFVLPECEQETLRRTLPYLTRLYIVSAGIGEDGSLREPDDEVLLKLASEYEVAPNLVLAPLDPTGFYDPGALSRLFSDPQKTERLLAELKNAAEAKRYRGVLLYFEELGDNEKGPYLTFLQKLKAAFAETDVRISAAVPPFDSPAADRFPRDADWIARIRETADGVFLTAYTWGSTESGPTAIAPIDRVRAALDGLSRLVPPSKISLGTPNFGYSWKIPYLPEREEPRYLSNLRALALAGEKSADILYSVESASPYFLYTDKVQEIAQEYETWFEDARSAKAMLDTVIDYNLPGFGVWTVNRYFPQLWLLAAALFRIEKE